MSLDVYGCDHNGLLPLPCRWDWILAHELVSIWEVLLAAVLVYASSLPKAQPEAVARGPPLAASVTDD